MLNKLGFVIGNGRIYVSKWGYPTSVGSEAWICNAPDVFEQANKAEMNVYIRFPNGKEVLVNENDFEGNSSIMEKEVSIYDSL
jgi:hypothetical protein